MLVTDSLKKETFEKERGREKGREREKERKREREKYHQIYLVALLKDGSK
jgi:hypothetical protein